MARPAAAGEPSLHRWMDAAVRMALRGHGRVEPNPMVGCVVLDRHGQPAGQGWHRRVGGPHAEVEALRAAGERARGGTAIVTLEPCNHHGRTPPCSQALLAAGIARVVHGTRDPNPTAAGGAAALAAAGVEVVALAHAGAAELNRPFVHRVRSGLPWVMAKWAQTIDGAIASATGVGRWISSPVSRAMVHRERGRVDAILTGMGTVLADDPSLTPRGVRLRRRALRVVVDASLSMPVECSLARSVADGPVLVATTEAALAAQPARATALRGTGVEVEAFPEDGGGWPDLRELLARLASGRGVSTVMVEAGRGLLSRLERRRLINEAWVFVGPLLMADPRAPRAADGRAPASPAEAVRLRLMSARRRGPDALLHYRWSE